ncbi:MAG TPA: kelch repeat-containing protein [Archangium sp.]|nr:kelch repeat-containing protein [Archangium sp.]
MKTNRWSLLLVGLASMAGGCQPEEPVQAPGAALESQKAALTVGTWTLHESSLLAHSGGHTATLLNDPGDVLVADGSGAEVYNPYTNTWRRTASMSTQRSYHTATELPSGKVLVAGGDNSDWPGGLSSAELYDPATGTWSPTGTMATPRHLHTAVRLDSGKVLVVGGGEYYDDYGPIDPPGEVYDPDTGTWSAVQGTFTPRNGASATVLYSGKVLVTGGYAWWRTATAQESDEVNIYDPATNSWSPAGKLARARWSHFSVRLYSGKVLIVGGHSGGNTVELYDPYSGQWSLGPPFPYDMTPLFSATMLYSGEVLVTDAIGQAALYDPTTNSWLPTPKMNVGRFFHPTTLLHTGEVLFVGGGNNNPRSVERFTR